MAALHPDQAGLPQPVPVFSILILVCAGAFRHLGLQSWLPVPGHGYGLLIIGLLRIELRHEPVILRLLFRRQLPLQPKGQPDAPGGPAVLQVAPAKLQAALPVSALPVSGFQPLFQFAVDLGQELHEPIVRPCCQHPLRAFLGLPEAPLLIMPFGQPGVGHVMAVVLRLQLLVESRRPPPVAAVVLLAPEDFCEIVGDHRIPRVFGQLPLQQVHSLPDSSLPHQHIGPAHLHHRMPDARGVRLLQAALSLLQPVLVQSLPAAVVTLQEPVVIPVLRPPELGEVQILPPFAPARDVIYEIGREPLPQELRVLHDGQPPVEQLPDFRGQLEMLRQEAQQLLPAVLFLLQGQEHVIVEKGLPELHVLSGADVSVYLHGPLQPQARGGGVPGGLLLVPLRIFRLSGVSAGLLIGPPQSLEALRVVLRVRHRQLLPVSAFQRPLILCSLDAKYPKRFLSVHIKPLLPLPPGLSTRVRTIEQGKAFPCSPCGPRAALAAYFKRHGALRTARAYKKGQKNASAPVIHPFPKTRTYPQNRHPAR